MNTSAALYYSIRSPYSYLGIMRLQQLLPTQPRPAALRRCNRRKPDCFGCRRPLGSSHHSFQRRTVFRA